MKEPIKLIIIAMLLIFGGALLFLANQQRSTSKSVNFRDYGHRQADSTIFLNQLSGKLPEGLWEVKSDTSIYLLYINGYGAAITKK